MLSLFFGASVIIARRYAFSYYKDNGENVPCFLESTKQMNIK